MQYYDSGRDPVDGTIYTYHWKSTSSTGTSTSIFDDLYLSTSANFPPSTCTRYMVNLPGEVYYDGVVAGTHPLLVKDVNTSTILTRVAYSASLTANTYKIFPASVETPQRMEVHSGVGSCQPGDKIAYDGYFVNTILSSTGLKSLKYKKTVNTFSASTDVTITGINTTCRFIDITIQMEITASTGAAINLKLGTSTGILYSGTTGLYLTQYERISSTGGITGNGSGAFENQGIYLGNYPTTSPYNMSYKMTIVNSSDSFIVDCYTYNSTSAERQWDYGIVMKSGNILDQFRMYTNGSTIASAFTGKVVIDEIYEENS